MCRVLGAKALYGVVPNLSRLILLWIRAFHNTFLKIAECSVCLSRRKLSRYPIQFIYLSDSTEEIFDVSLAD